MKFVEDFTARFCQKFMRDIQGQLKSMAAQVAEYGFEQKTLSDGLIRRLSAAEIKEAFRKGYDYILNSVKEM